MQILFVASGNSENFEIAPFIKSQGETINSGEIDVDYFPILGKGMKGYLKSAKKLNEYVRNKNFDLIHAHYTLSGWAAVLGRTGLPIVLSVMGSDAYGNYVGKGKVSPKSRFLTFTTYAIQPFVDKIISKSKNIDDYIYYNSKAYIIPNGVQLEQFKYSPEGYYHELGLDKDKQYILFLGDPENKRKNYPLVKKAIDKLENQNCEILAPYPISHDTVVKYLNTVDVFVMPAFMEGSPNVVKEALACNCPIVATDVGDVKWVLGDIEGCFISSFNPNDFAKNLENALQFAASQEKTNGRNRLVKLGLDSESVAKKIKSIYQGVLGK